MVGIYLLWSSQPNSFRDQRMAWRFCKGIANAYFTIFQFLTFHIE
jgi:hypothetical protein